MDAAFDACRKMLEFYLDTNPDEEIEVFGIEMGRDLWPDRSSQDPALLNTFQRLWLRYDPTDDTGAFRCCIEFLKEELISLRPLKNERFVNECERAAVSPAHNVLWLLWQRAR
jgi:hypothetical protein